MVLTPIDLDVWAQAGMVLTLPNQLQSTSAASISQLPIPSSMEYYDFDGGQMESNGFDGGQMESNGFGQLDAGNWEIPSAEDWANHYDFGI